MIMLGVRRAVPSGGGRCCYLLQGGLWESLGFWLCFICLGAGYMGVCPSRKIHLEIPLHMGYFSVHTL